MHKTFGSPSSLVRFSDGSPGSVAGLLESMPFAHISELPRIDREQKEGREPHDPELIQRTATLFGSYVADEPVAVAWFRSEGQPLISVAIGGAALITSRRTSGPCAVNLPSGATGILARWAELREALAEYSTWLRISGRLDPTVVDDPSRRRETGAPLTIEDTLTSAWQDRFAWIVLASPIPTTEVRALSQTLALQIPSLRSKAGNSEQYAVDLEREEHRYRELRRAERRGLWSVHLLVGASDADATRRLGALVCGSFHFDWLPYTLAPTGGTDSLATLLEQSVDDELGTSPFEASTDLLAAVATPPRVEVPGVQLRRRPNFDVSPETTGEVLLGTILDRAGRSAGSMPISHEALNRHTFVCGATGSGKSQTIRGLLESLSRSSGEPIHWLVIEPAKAEYRGMAGRLAGLVEVTAIRPGIANAVAAGINPLEPEPGFPLQTHLDLTKALFLASFEAKEPFPQVLSAALTRCYVELGWDLTLGESRRADVTPRWPTLRDLQRVAKDVVTKIGYGEDVMRDVRGFVDVRISSLRHGTPGRFFEGGHPLDIGQLLDRNVVLEIEDLGDDRDKAFLMGVIIIRLVEHLRLRSAREGDPGTLRHLTVIEEAHRLLRRPEGIGPAVHAVELFASLLAEVRAYGEGIVIAEQIPSKLITDAVKNTAIKIVHRLPALDDRHAVGATMNLTHEQSEYIVTVKPGTAGVFADGMDFPSLVCMPFGGDRETRDKANLDPPLADRFSVACGPDCRAKPCTLRQMRTAQRCLEDDARIVLWSELAVLAHILGFSAPAPNDELNKRLAELDRRMRDCALAHAVHRAVEVRAAALWHDFSPGELAEHVSEVLRAMLEDPPVPCGDDDWRWQAGPFRWNQLRSMLATACEAGAGRIPDSSTWEERYRTEIPGDSAVVQLDAVNGWVDAQETRRPAVLFGAEHPSPLERAVGAGREESGWRRALAKSLTQAVVIEKPWPQAYLAREQARGEPGR